MDYDNLETIRKCMSLLPAADCEYEEWIHFGMVLKDIGGDCCEWENWSLADARYHEGEC